MAQFQAEIPHPLAHDTPCLLSTSGVTTPAIWILLFVFISQSCFKRAAMQVEGHHIRRSKGTLWEIGQEEFIDDACTGNPDPTPGGAGRVSCNDETDELSCFAQRLVRAVIERATDPTGLPA